jgi:Ca-activated chloride channel family protein
MRTFAAALALFVTASAAWAGDLIPTDRRFGPLRVASHKVEVTVDNQIAMTRVEQIFANDHPATLEAHYVFPVPKGASIIDFSMTVNGKLIRGELLEKDRARTIYEGIVRQSKDPGLLEHVGANLFRVRVFPILSGAQQKIELTYVERVPYDAGSCRYVYPLLVPGGAATTKADLFEFRWRLTSAVPIKEVTCATHAADVTRQAESTAEVKFTGRQIDLSKDLEIGYRIERAASGMDLAAHRPKDEDGTFMLLLTPTATPVRLPKDMTFVFDTSGSMEGTRIRQAKAALKFCLSKLHPDDRFNILSFSSGVTTFENQHQPATDEIKARGEKFVDALDASGGTNINEALLRALAHKAADGRPHLILFLTDGEPTSGVTLPAEILRNVAAANSSGVRIFAFGVGESLNRGLLEDLAEATHAVAEFVSDKESIEEKVSRLQKKIATPVISEMTIDWGQAEVSAVHPRTLGDLFAGTQLMVMGRYRKAGTFEVTLKGRTGMQPVVLKQQLTFPERIDVAPAIPYLWATRKVAGLLDEIRKHGENKEIVDEVIALAKQYRIATPYTSFLVLESEAAYDQHGIDRKGNTYKAPTPTVLAPPPPGTPGNSDHAESKGDGVYDTMGVGQGGGGGGRFGGRFGGRENLVARGGGSMATESAALASLKWLARHQGADGSWNPETYDAQCVGGACTGKGNKECTVGVTGLSLLAFLGAGYSHISKEEYPDPANPGRVLKFGEVVKKALQYLLSVQQPDGCVGERSAKFMYDHAIAALALSEAYGMTASLPLKEPAQKAIDFLVASQNPGKGWRYTPKSGDNDTSVTGWAVMALKSAELSELTYPLSSRQGAMAWFDEVTESTGYNRTGYNARGVVKATLPGLDATYDQHETMSAVAMFGRIMIEKRKTDPRLGGAASLLVADLPEMKPAKTDYNYWYFGTLALFQYDGPDGPMWKKWNEPMKNALVPSQKTGKEGCLHGSWDPTSRWAEPGGRIWATAINSLTLEVYYRYANVFGGSKK